MFFGRQTRQEISLNTSFFTSYSETCLLQVGGWNKQLSISFKPCTGTDANGIRTYAEDKSQYVITSLTADNAIAMIEGFEKYILPAIKSGDEASISIVMGGNEQRKVITLKYDGTDAYISVSTGLNESGVSTNTITHKFNKKNYLVGYKPATGDYTEESTESELFIFMNKVRKVDDLVPVQAHARRYYDMTHPVPQQQTGYNNQRPQTQNIGNSYQAPTTTSEPDMPFLPFD